MIIRIEINFNMVHITTGLISTLMVFILVMQGNVSRTIPEGAIIIKSDFECHIDDDCVEQNKNSVYCDTNLNLCSQCLNCSIYFRMPKKNIKCPKDVNDCSICLKGYSEETFFGGEIRDKCISNDLNLLPTPAQISSSSYWEEFGIIFIILNISLFFLVWIYFYKKISETNSNNVSNVFQDYEEQQPPPYYSCMKLNNYVTDDVQEFHLFTGEEPPRNEWRHQNAVPFRLLNDSLDNINHHVDENRNIEEVDGIVMRVLEIEAPELHDEETMPSVWTPPLPLPPMPSLPETIRLQTDSQTDPPPPKRVRLDQQPIDEKSYQDEDNMSDISQDE